MSEQEQEQQTETEAPADPVEPEPVEPEPEPEPEPEQPAEPQPGPQAVRDDVDAEAIYSKLDTRSKNYVKSLGEILEGAGVPVVICEMCADAYPGIRWEKPGDDLHAQLVAVVAEHEHGAPLKDDPNAELCTQCDGFGVVKLPSHVPNNQMRPCRACNGVGWRELHPQSGTPQAPAITAPNGEAEPYAGVPLDDPSVVDLRARGFTVIPPMQPLEAAHQVPHTYVKPARVTFHSTDLATDVRRTYGYEARCACGWQGDVHRKHGDAQWEAKVHRHTEHRQ